MIPAIAFLAVGTALILWSGAGIWNERIRRQQVGDYLSGIETLLPFIRNSVSENEAAVGLWLVRIAAILFGVIGVTIGLMEVVSYTKG